MMRRPVFDSFLPRTAVLLLGGTLVLGAPARAQLARPRTAAPDAPKILVLPFVRDNIDSALSLVVADGMRERLRVAHLDKFNTITRENLCRNLTESGFPCDVPLDAQTIRNLIRFMNTKYAVEGSMIRRRGDSIIVVARLYEANGNPPTALTATVANAAPRIGASTGGDLANRLVDGYRSFEPVAECRRRLDLHNFAGALQKAQDALHQFPGNAGAYVCIARVIEAQGGSADSVLASLHSAYERDTLNPAVMRLLAAKYQAKFDTTNLIDMLKRILTIDFRDNDLRINTIRLLAQMGQVDSAIAIANKGLVENPASAELLGAKAIAEAAGSHWDSAAVAMQQVSEIDTSKVDSLFIYRITNYLKQIPDSAGYLTWVRNATVKFPSQANYWYALGELSFAKADTAGALSAAQHYTQLRPDDPRGHLALARYLVATNQLDSALAHASAITDTTMLPFTGNIYLAAGVKSYRDSLYPQAIQRLEIAKARTTGRALSTAGYVLALSQFKIVAHIDSIAEGTHNCDSARAARALWDQIEANITIGVAQNRELASQFLGQIIPQYKQREDTMIHQYCH